MEKEPKQMSGVRCLTWIGTGTVALLLLGYSPKVLTLSGALVAAVWLRRFKWFSWSRWLGGMAIVCLLYAVWTKPPSLGDLAEKVFFVLAVALFMAVGVAWDSWPRVRPWMVGTLILWFLLALGFCVQSVYRFIEGERSTLEVYEEESHQGWEWY